MNLDFGIVLKNLPLLLHGAEWTVMLTIASLVLGTVIGFVACFGRLLGGGLLSWISTAYVELFRTLPEMVTIFWIYYCFPFAFDLSLSPTGSGIVALSLFAGAVLAEVFRAGIEAVPLGQVHAAKSLGLSELRIWYSVILPQALRLMIPAFILVVADLVKMSGLLSAIGVSELVYEASILSENSFRYFEFFTVIGIVYFIIIFPTSLAARRLDARFVAQRT